MSSSSIDLIIRDLLANLAIELKDCNDTRIKKTFHPVTKKSVSYIVSVILLNELDQIVLMQEAKPQCYGKWYLPAGRVEPNETLIDAAKRELTEETGLTFEPATLIFVEVQFIYWYRFTFTGVITGGKLKDESAKDKESLQARWFDVKDILSGKVDVRSTDIMRLIEVAVKHRKTSSGLRTITCLPLPISHRSIHFRCIIMHQGDRVVHVVKSKRDDERLPVTTVGVNDRAITCSINNLLQMIFGKNWSSVGLLGVVGVEYGGSVSGGHDGLCLTVAYAVHDGQLPIGNEAYVWHVIQDVSLVTDVSNCIIHSRFIPLEVL